MERAIIATILLLAPAHAFAHDSWLRVKALAPEVAMAFATGEVFPKSETATKPARVASFVIIDEQGREQKLTAIADEELELVGRMQTKSTPRLAAIALNPHFIELEAKEFEDYLKEEGDDAAIAERAKRKESNAKGREYYTKHAKVLISRSAASKGASKVVGHTLELVPVDDTFAPSAGDELRVRVLLRGKPLSGARVALGREGLAEHSYAAQAIADKDGIARIPAAAAGLCFLRTHVMERKDASDADWQSFWASLTFEVSPKK